MPRTPLAAYGLTLAGTYGTEGVTLSQERAGLWRHVAAVAYKLAVVLLAVGALAAMTIAYVTFDQFEQDVNVTDALEHDSGHVPPDEDDAVDILLVGTDARTDMQGEPLPEETLHELGTEHREGVSTDTLIILRIPDDGGSPTAVSIPRDSWMEVPSGGHGKINSVYETAKEAEKGSLRMEGAEDDTAIERESDQAGRSALVQAVENFTDVRIDHYAEVSMLGFYLLTEALDGVEICLNNATQDAAAAADFQAGPQVADGSDALSFVRQRQNLPRGDLDRINRQQAFLASALHEAFSAGTLSDRKKLEDLNEAVQRSVVVDSNLDVFDFADQLSAFTSGDIEFVTIPVANTSGRSDDGQSIIEVDKYETREFIAGLAGTEGESNADGGGSAPTGGGARTGGQDEPISADGVACVN